MKTKNKHYHLDIQKLKLEAQKEVKLDQSTQDNCFKLPVQLSTLTVLPLEK